MAKQLNYKDILDGTFWKNIIDNIYIWFKKDFLTLILMIIIFYIVLKLYKILTKKLSLLIIKFTKANINNLETEKRVKTIVFILRGIGRIIIWTTFILMFFKRIGLDITPILAGAGILGLAVGFGAQELVRDFISGFFLILENQIRTGDVVKINEVIGEVEKIELRTTTIRDVPGVVHIFQNGKINTIANLTKFWSATVVEIGVSYNEDIDKVINLMESVAKNMRLDENWQNYVDDIEVLGVESFGTSSVNVRIKIKTIPNKQWDVAREYRKRLFKKFKLENITIPFNQLDVNLYDKRQ